MDPEVKDEGGGETFDMDAGVAQIADGLGFEQEEPPEAPELAEPVEDEAQAEVVTEPIAARPAPKSWSKETHELWAKLPPEAQEQVERREKQMLDGIEAYKADSGLGRQMRDTITPYRALLASQGVDEVKAVSVLMNAHYKLSTLPPSERGAYFASLAQTYGIDLGQAAPAQRQAVDPVVQKLQDQVAKLTNTMTEKETREFEAYKGRITNDVNAFAEAKDDKGAPLHPYFNEVADDIIVYINAGVDLNEAYERAVRANPVTYKKELARLQTETQAQLRTKAKQEAEAARKASSANVRSRDTRRAPTEPMGKMEDTMKETLREINSRAH